MSEKEKLVIVVEADGTRTIKRELDKIGEAGERAADRISDSLKKALKDQAYNTRVAMNSTRLAEQFKIREARAAAAEVKRIRAEETKAAVEAGRQQVASARAAAREQIKAARQAAQEARATARQETQAARQAAREKAQAARQAAREAVQAARQAARDKAAIERNELAAHRSALRAKTLAERAAAREAAAILRARRRQEADERKKERDAKRDATLGLGPQVAAFASLYGVASAVRGFAAYSDSITNVNNRLKMVTKSQAELEQLTQSLRQTALNSRSEFDLTTRSYARLAQATAQLNLSQTSNLAMTETLTKAIAVSGATGAEAHATLIQLSQAMASNRLSADEFRSVSEQLPIILDLLADSTGRARTELKQMGENGELTARTLALAILQGQEKIREQFRKTTPTIEQSMENIRTELRFTIDEFNKATGASESIVKALQWVAKNLDTCAIAAKALGAAISVYLIGEVGLAIKALFTLAAANPWTAAAIGLASLIALVIQYRKEIQAATTDSDAAYFAVIQNTPAGALTEEQKEAVRTGVTPMKRIRDAEAAKKFRESQYDMRQDAGWMADQEQDIASLQFIARPTADKDSKTKRGRHQTTFMEAIASLLQENMALRVNKSERDKLNTVLDIQEKLKRKLLPTELQTVQALVNQNKALKDQETIMDRITDMNYERSLTHIGRGEVAAQNRAVLELQKEIGRNLTDDEAGQVRSAARGLYRDQENARKLEEYFTNVPEQLKEKEKREEERRNLRSRLEMGDFSGLSSREDFANARASLRESRADGMNENQFIMSMEALELIDEATPKMRKLFLEETTGIGAFAQQCEAIFGLDGILVKGFADAAANAIVFGESFKKTINQLGKQIQAEIISTLIQGMIRMSILSAFGGASSGASARSSALVSMAATLPGKASGGHAPGGRTQVAGVYHGGEYIVNAQATSRNRPLLESINKGATPAMGAPRAAQKAPSITFIDQAGVQIEHRQLTTGDVELIARKAVNQHAARVIAGSIADSNSRVNKALKGHTNVKTQR